MEPIRRNGLVVEQKGPEVLVRDVERQTTYALNKAAFAVFGLCDGATSVIQTVCGLLAMEMPGADPDVVRRALQELVELSLVTVDAPISKGKPTRASP